jgi:HK97 family phage prohead protease
MDRHNCGFEYKFVADGPEGTFEGYGSTFGMLDDGGDMMMPGCFDKTLAQCKAAGAMPKMLLNHGGMAWGSPTPEDMIPIGKWSTDVPDSNGLQAKGRLINLDTESGKRIYGAMKEGELGGLSIGYKARDFTRGTKPGEPRRTLKAVDLLRGVAGDVPGQPRARSWRGQERRRA